MNIRKLTLSLAVALGCSFAVAQEAEGTIEYVFQPHWYGQIQGGGQETLGEDSFKKLLCPNAQVGVGYNFHPLWGARLSVNGWQSKAAISYNDVYAHWKWNYVAPMVDVTFNLSNFIGGYNPTRLVDVNIFAGIGANIGFNNDQAVKHNKQLSMGLTPEVLQYIWSGNQALLTGRFGAAVDFRLSQHVALGLELQANTLSDKYNSKKAGNADWYFNGYVGVKYTFGKTHTTRVIPPVNVEPQIIVEERVVEKIVEVPVEVEPSVEYIIERAKNLPITRNIFFTISNTKISLWEMQKVREIAEYLDAHPTATVSIKGYADKGTGTKAINLRLSRQRAEVVANTLIKEFGISPSRIETSSMSYDEPDQPFKTEQLNRVAICVASMPE